MKKKITKVTPEPDMQLGSDKYLDKVKKMVDFTIDSLLENITARLKRGEVPKDDINAFKTYVEGVDMLNYLIRKN